jgi:hypothetical protein
LRMHHSLCNCLTIILNKIIWWSLSIHYQFLFWLCTPITDPFKKLY